MKTIHKIQWLNLPGYKGETWNPIIGCSKVSDGCKNCYAERMANRLAHNPKTKADYSEVITDGKWNGKTTLVHNSLFKPAGWRLPRLIFVCSMGDLFHESISFDAINMIFEEMNRHARHIFIVLTKRPERLTQFAEWKIWRKDVQNIPWRPSENVWIGVTAENQEQANARIPHLMKIPAAVKFVSIEPMLSQIDISFIRSSSCSGYTPLKPHPIGSPDRPFINWVICGGESGHNARPVHPDWVRSLKDQCQAAEVPFFFKQWGEYKPMGTMGDFQILPFGKYDPESKFGFLKTGKHKSGNTLDGVKYEEYPNEIKPARLRQSGGN